MIAVRYIYCADGTWLQLCSHWAELLPTHHRCIRRGHTQIFRGGGPRRVRLGRSPLPLTDKCRPRLTRAGGPSAHPTDN